MTMLIGLRISHRVIDRGDNQGLVGDYPKRDFFFGMARDVKGLHGRSAAKGIILVSS